MPIYSRNSVSDVVVANENYSYRDMGKILSECVQNDNIVFNAVLRNSFAEATAIHEGTMVSSELTAFREASLKEAWAGLQAKLKKLWEKIKGVFRSVYAKLTVWFVRNGKSFVAMHRKTLATKPGLGNCEIPVYLKPAGDPGKYADKLGTAATAWIEGEKNVSAEDVEDATNKLLGTCISGATKDDFAKKFKEEYFTELKDKKFSDLGVSVDNLFDTITTKSSAIKKLKDAEKKVDGSLKKVSAELKKKASKSENDEEKGSYERASKYCSAYESAITITTRCAIQAVKTEVKQARMIIGKLVAYGPKSESAVLEEFAWLEGADDFDSQEDTSVEDLTDEDVANDPDVAIDIVVNTDGDEE